MVRATARPLLIGAALSAAAAGCIPLQVQAPDEPIEINLNVNIRHEVIVRLDQEARDLLNDNPDLFGAPQQ